MEELHIAKADPVVVGSVASVEVIDEYTIRANLKVYDNYISYNLCITAGGMVSPTAWETHGAEWGQLNPIGTGPFKFVSWERDVGIKYERFDGYWQEGKPYLDGIEFVLIPDPVVRAASFTRQEVDILDRAAALQAKELREQDKYVVTAIAAGKQDLGCSVRGDTKWDDVRLRKAIGYAIDTQAIVDKLSYGFDFASNQWGTPASWCYSPNVKGYPYDPDKARELLAEAGYPDGFKTNIINFNTGDNPHRTTAIQGYLSEVGIDASVELHSPGGIYEIATQKGWDEMMICSMRPGGTEVPKWMKRYLRSDGLMYINLLRSDELDRLIDQANTTPDFETRKALTWKAQEYVYDEQCIVTSFIITAFINVKYPGVHDDRFGVGNQEQWTPEDVWLEQ